MPDLRLATPPHDSVRQRVRADHPHVTVAADVDLLRAALLSLTPPLLTAPQPRWVLVKGALGHGAGVSRSICNALGVDPDEDVEADAPDWLEDLDHG